MSPKICKTNPKSGLKNFKASKVVAKLQTELKKKDSKISLLKKKNEKLSKDVVEMTSSHQSIEQKDKNVIQTYKKEIEKMIEEARKRESDMKRSKDMLKRTHEEKVRHMENSYEDLKGRFGRCREQLEWITEENKEMRKTSVDRRDKQEDNSWYVERMEKLITRLKKQIFNLEEDPEMRRMAPEVRKRMNNGIRILCLDHKKMLDKLYSNMNKLAHLHPKKLDIRFAKDHLERENQVYDEYLNNVAAEVRRIRANPSISIQQLGRPIEEFPSAEFRENYVKWVKENNLEL